MVHRAGIIEWIAVHSEDLALIGVELHWLKWFLVLI